MFIVLPSCSLAESAAQKLARADKVIDKFYSSFNYALCEEGAYDLKNGPDVAGAPAALELAPAMCIH